MRDRLEGPFARLGLVALLRRRFTVWRIRRLNIKARRMTDKIESLWAVVGGKKAAPRSGAASDVDVIEWKPK